ncbi:MAG: TetR family transcriptional regulator [Acidimicrobiales bacterium]
MNASSRRVGRPRVNPLPRDQSPREEVVAVASRMFALHGFAAVKMSEIAASSGLRQSSIYYYFNNKEEILAEIVGEVNRLGLERLLQVNSQGESAGLRLFRTLRFDAEMLCRLPYDVNEILRMTALQEERFSRYWSDRQDLNDGVEALVAEGIAAGEFLELDARLAALTLLSNDEAVQNWYRPLGTHRLQGDYQPHEIGAFLATMALQALLADRRRLPLIRRLADRLDADLDTDLDTDLDERSAGALLQRPQQP